MDIWHRLTNLETERTLVVMRHADIVGVYPKMDTSHICAACREAVGIHVSGLQTLRQYKRVRIVCLRCHGPGPAP